MPVDSKSRLAANDLSDWMKRQSPACSMKEHHRLGRGRECAVTRTNTMRLRPCEHGVRRPEVEAERARRARGHARLADGLDAGELVLLAQLLLDVRHGLAHLCAGKEVLLELVVVDVL